MDSRVGRAGTRERERRGLALLVAAVLLLLSALPGGAQQELDVVIRDGRVLDGTGNPWRRADVGIVDGRIAAVGDLEDRSAARVVDASDLYVAPGFIDAHSHAGGGLASPELSAAEPLLAQGVTTVFVNPDGGGPIDLREQRDSLERDGLGVHAAQMVPHGSIRREVIGTENRAPTDAELDRMKETVRRGMEAGAFGLSSGLFYAPGSFAETEELVELARVAAEYGGVYSSHIRDEADYSVGLVAAVDEVVRIAEEGGLPGIVTHVKALGPRVWGYSGAVIRRIERARERGVEVWADQYPYEASATSLISALVPRWAEEGGRDSLVQRTRDPEVLPRLKEGIRDGLDRRGGADRIQFRRFEEDPSIEGSTLAEVADRRGLDPVEATLRLIREGSPQIVSFNMDASDVEAFMRRPWVMTSSDGGLVEMGEGVPHPRNYGAFPRKIRVYVNERGVVSLEQAVRSMTHLPAAVLGMPDRGQIRPGAAADVVVFDPASMRDRGTFQDPHQLAEGVEYVLVGGEFAIDGGDFTGVLAGEVLSRR